MPGFILRNLHLPIEIGFSNERILTNGQKLEYEPICERIAMLHLTRDNLWRDKLLIKFENVELLSTTLAFIMSRPRRRGLNHRQCQFADET